MTTAHVGKDNLFRQPLFCLILQTYVMITARCCLSLLKLDLNLNILATFLSKLALFAYWSPEVLHWINLHLVWALDE